MLPSGLSLTRLRQLARGGVHMLNATNGLEVAAPHDVPTLTFLGLRQQGAKRDPRPATASMASDTSPHHHVHTMHGTSQPT